MYRLTLHDLNELDAQDIMFGDFEHLVDLRDKLQVITNRYTGLFLSIESIEVLESDE